MGLVSKQLINFKTDASGEDWHYRSAVQLLQRLIRSFRGCTSCHVTGEYPVTALKQLLLEVKLAGCVSKFLPLCSSHLHRNRQPAKDGGF